MAEEQTPGAQRLAAEALYEAEDLKAVLATAAGRAVLWRILSDCRIYSDGFNGGDRALMAFDAGRRNLGLSLLEKVLTLNSEAYILMRDEAQQRKRSLDASFKPQETE